MAEEAPKRRRGRPPAQKPPLVDVQPTNLDEAIKAQQEENKKAVQDLARSFAQLLLIGTVLAALMVQQEHVAMTRKEASDIAQPLASIVSKTQLYKRYGKALVDSHDFVALAWAMYQYSARVIEGWQHAPDFGEAKDIPTEHFEAPGRNGSNGGQQVPTRSVQTNPFGVSPKGREEGGRIPFFGRPD